MHAAMWYMRYGLLAKRETQLVISKELKYINKEEMEEIEEKLDRLPTMITVLMGKLK